MRTWAPLRARLLFVCFAVSQAVEGSYVPPALIPVDVNIYDAQIPSFSVAPSAAGDGSDSRLPVIGGQPALSTSSQAAPIISSPTPVIIGVSSTPTAVQTVPSVTPPAVAPSSSGNAPNASSQVGKFSPNPASLPPQLISPPSSSTPAIASPASSTPPVQPSPLVESIPPPIVSSASPRPPPVDSVLPLPPPSPSPTVASSAGTVGDIGQPGGGSAQPAQPANTDNTNSGNAPAPVPVAPLVDLDGSPDKIAGEPSLATDPNACSCACACPFDAFGIPAASISPYTPEPLSQFLASTFATVVTPVMMSSNVPVVTPNAPAVSPKFREAGSASSLPPPEPIPPPIQSTPPVVAPSPVPTPVPTPDISSVPIVLEPSTTTQAAVTSEPDPAPAQNFDIDSVELHSALTLKIGG